LKEITLTPTRIEGHLTVKVLLDGKKIIEAFASGTMYRGIELLMQGRTLIDATFLASRVCGVCSLPHTLASITAVERALNTAPPSPAIILRNLAMYAYLIYDHILHCCILVGHDYAPPHGVVEELKWGEGRVFMGGLKAMRKALEALAIIGGKFPHTSSIIVGGASMKPDLQKLFAYASRLREVNRWIMEIMMPTFEKLHEKYSSELISGEREANLITYGVLDDPSLDPKKRVFKPGVIIHGNLVATDLFNEIEPHIQEDETYTYESLESSEALSEQVSGQKRYSYVKAPRYKGYVMETGPLARLWVNALLSGGKIHAGVFEWRPPRKPSTIERVYARAFETVFLCDKVFDEIEKALEMFQRREEPFVWIPWREERGKVSGVGLIEAARGALGHWVEAEGFIVKNYKIISPTTWNTSPRDKYGKRGAMEEALVNTEISSTDPVIDIVRVIRAFDPCMACAVHTITLSESSREIYTRTISI
jgi:hydrogenase large subunit